MAGSGTALRVGAWRSCHGEARHRTACRSRLGMFRSGRVGYGRASRSRPGTFRRGTVGVFSRGQAVHSQPKESLMAFAKKDRQRIIDGYLAATGRNLFVASEFIDWLGEHPEHEAYEW